MEKRIKMICVEAKGCPRYDCEHRKEHFEIFHLVDEGKRSLCKGKGRCGYKKKIILCVEYDKAGM